jgi:hypothetical protein
MAAQEIAARQTLRLVPSVIAFSSRASTIACVLAHGA